MGQIICTQRHTIFSLWGHSCAKNKRGKWPWSMRNRTKWDVKNPRPDLKTSECLFSESVEISDPVETSTLSEISTKMRISPKMRFLTRFRPISRSGTRISQFPGSLELFQAYYSFRQQILTFPATFDRFPARIGLRPLLADFRPDNGRKSKFCKNFLCVGKMSVWAFQRTSNQVHISFSRDSKPISTSKTQTPKISNFGIDWISQKIAQKLTNTLLVSNLPFFDF